MCICITIETKAFAAWRGAREGHNGVLWWNDGLLLEEDLMDWTAVEEKDSSEHGLDSGQFERSWAKLCW
jgi:hypothetical protein